MRLGFNPQFSVEVVISPDQPSCRNPALVAGPDRPRYLEDLERELRSRSALGSPRRRLKSEVFGAPEKAMGVVREARMPDMRQYS